MVEKAYRESVCSHVARILKQEREKQGISMTRLAELAGLSQGMISLIEHELRNPSLDTLLRICAPLDLELSAVLHRAERAAGKSTTK